ncbi:acyl-CoA dehydrogenase [Geothermobacter hydrogeniphilus]|uniref:Acyl-CoA dehydrogenase n=1 Tax=Geothermobacter hydrogeniphilus TaxID=1969733 RepID=A0A2K2HCJ6_9BACT|nr:acyl-CoA dehydrogenase family protein [Geothermobacter hydrogeniphilus]PNU21042.1 acyl-CoA dehydrogenase [Geothermobacter hydrogeniphilus]
MSTLPAGGEFLLRPPAIAPFVPEDFTTEQRQIAATTKAFINNEILPDLDRLEQQDFTLLREKLRRCAELGLFLVDIPEEYDGLELDKATSMLVAETIGPSGSFAITSSGQTGIGSLPLVYYGTAEQKQKYLEKLTSGAWIGAYCLTEPDCGSDPLSARATATLSKDGSCYILNGVKQFITNAAFADLFTVFAKIYGRQFSAFLVERQMDGLSIGREEQKMGLKGTSTAQVILENVRVPVDNLLGEAGKGHKIAFNVLNIGRLKLAATVVGAAKGALAEAAGYAGERKQFGRRLIEFGAIGEKLADMSAALFAAESVLYRVAGLLDARIAALDRGGDDYYQHYQQAIEEYAGECAIAKVLCSETLAQVADEALQIHGGYGYIRDYPVERFYRDQRINRIFEGTNEINRMLIPTLLLRRADEGRLDLWPRAQAVKDAWDSDKREETGQELLANVKTLYLLLLASVQQRRGEQEILLALGDMAVDIFALESSLLRVHRAVSGASAQKRSLLEAAAGINSFEITGRLRQSALRLNAYGSNDPELLPGQIERLCRYPGTGLLAAKRSLAAATGEAGGYPF